MTSEPGSFVHPTAVVDTPSSIGEGTKIWHFCHISAGASLGPGNVLGQNVFVAGTVRTGRNCRIQNNVSLYDGVLLEDNVFVGPSAVFTNVLRPRAAFPRRHQFQTTKIGADATIGANATIVCGVEIGEGAFVGAGAVVRKSVPAFALVVGAPARRIGWVCRCGEPLNAALTCVVCGRNFDACSLGLKERR